MFQNRDDLEIQKNVSIKKWNSFQVGGEARFFLKPKSISALQYVLETCEKKSVPYFFLGAGTNVIFSDRIHSHVVISMLYFNKEITFLENGNVYLGASVRIPVLIKKALENGWSSFENILGVPGTIGGALFMNAGTACGTIGDIVEKVEVLSKKEEKEVLDGARAQDSFYKDSSFYKKTYFRKDLKFTYRKNLFLKKSEVLLGGVFKVRKVPKEQIKEKWNALLKKRAQSQPLQEPSCGSVFKNSNGKKAWQLIDGVGLRGYEWKGARFSEKHCNFIIRGKNASAQSIYELMQIAKERVWKKYKIKLEEEVRCVGFD